MWLVFFLTTAALGVDNIGVSEIILRIRQQANLMHVVVIAIYIELDSSLHGMTHYNIFRHFRQDMPRAIQLHWCSTRGVGGSYDQHLAYNG